MEYLTDLDEYKDAFRSVFMNESAESPDFGNMECYNKCRKILDVPEMIKCHKRCLDINFDELTEDDVNTVNELYDLGVERGLIIPDEPEETPEVAPEQDEMNPNVQEPTKDIGDGSEMYDVDGSLYESYLEAMRSAGDFGSVDQTDDEILRDEIESMYETDDFDTPQSDELPGRDDYEAEMEYKNSLNNNIAADEEDIEGSKEAPIAPNDTPTGVEDNMKNEEESQVEEPAQDDTPAEEDPSEEPADEPAQSDTEDSGEPISDETPADDTTGEPSEETATTDDTTNPDEQVVPTDDETTTANDDSVEDTDGDTEEDTGSEETTDDDSSDTKDSEDDEEEKELTSEEKKQLSDEYVTLWRKTLKDLNIETPLADVTDPAIKAEFWDTISNGWDKNSLDEFMTPEDLQKIESDEVVEIDNPTEDSDEDAEETKDDSDDSKEDDSKEDDSKEEDSEEKPEEDDSEEEDTDDESKEEETDDSKEEEKEEDKSDDESDADDSSKEDK